MPVMQDVSDSATSEWSRGIQMARLVNHLLQLQELCDTREEQTAISDKRDLTELDSSIEQLLEELPKPVSMLYRKIAKRNPRVIIPVEDGTCSGCGAEVPRGAQQRIADGDRPIQCETCRRMLYCTEGHPRYLKDRESEAGRPSHGLIRFSAADLMESDLDGETFDEAIAALAKRMQEGGYIQSAEGVTEQALRREAIASTAVGKALAFPHVRSNESGILTMAVGVHRKGFHAKAPDRRKVRIVFLMVIPAAASAFYLRLLSSLVSAFSSTDARDQLLACKTSEEMWESLLNLTASSV